MVQFPSFNFRSFMPQSTSPMQSPSTQSSAMHSPAKAGQPDLVSLSTQGLKMSQTNFHASSTPGAVPEGFGGINPLFSERASTSFGTKG